ncbi:MAG TPA: hypothetical protein VER58_09220 [Thermoanaerobaculia bacterium]|nr:hypothetical protein [Thermoanaerobaculia bacterium]
MWGAAALGGRSAVERLCALATAAALVPIWLFRFFPTQDGPSHLYNAFVLAHYFDRANIVIREYLILNTHLFPNWTTYVAMAALMRIFPPLIVQQIVLSICVICIPAAVIYLQKSFKAAADATALLGVLLAFSYILFMGFFNFIVGAALFIFTIGFWWRRRKARYLYALYALLIAIYLSHGLAFAATLMAIAILAATERRWRVLGELAPAVVLFILDAVARTGGQPLFRSLLWHLRQLPSFFAAGHIAISYLVLALVALGVVWGRASARPMVLVSAALFIAYFVMPWGYSAGGQQLQAGWINERLLFLAILTLPAWIALPRPAIATALFLIAIAAHIGMTSIQIAKLNRYIGEIVKCAPLIRPHSTIQTLFPPSNQTPQVTPTLHLTGYFGLQTDVVDLDDYEARLPDFPLAYRPALPPRPPDAVVIWRGAQVRRVIGYRVVCSNSEIRLLQKVQ